MLWLITFTLTLRKSESAYHLSSSKENINCFLFIDNSNLYAKNEKDLDPLAQTVRIFSDDIGMEFGIGKCATLVLKRKKNTKFDGISLPDKIAMKWLTEGAGWKYLGILQAYQI